MQLSKVLLARSSAKAGAGGVRAGKKLVTQKAISKVNSIVIKPKALVSCMQLIVVFTQPLPSLSTLP
jgi:hypothetical protein